MASWLMLEYLCPDGHRFESLQLRKRPARVTPCSCGRRATRTISAVKERKVWGSAAVRGKSDPPPSPTAMNAVGVIGETKSKSQWKQERSKMWRDFDRQRRRKAGAPI